MIAKTIDVSEAGVGGAKGFFETIAQQQANSNKFEKVYIYVCVVEWCSVTQ